MAPTVGQKIENYAKQNLKELKREEAKSKKEFTKYDIAELMVKKGALSAAEMNNWLRTTEGSTAQTMSAYQKNVSIFGQKAFDDGQPSYLDELEPFADKSDMEKAKIMYSPNKGLKFGATKAERAKRDKEIKTEIKQQKVKQQILNPKKAAEEKKFVDHLNSLPDVSASYTDLMDAIRMDDMSQAEKIDLLFKRSGERFYDAWQNGDTKTAKAELMQGLGLVFQVMDNKAGITKFKEWAKERTGLNTLVDMIDKAVDDGNEANLSKAEQIWENLKGVGDFADSLAGTQGIVMIGAFMALGEAVAVGATATLSETAAATVITGFQALLTTYFGAEGAELVYDGIKENLNASTKEEARAAGQKLGSGAFMAYGAAKGVKSTYENAKGLYQTHKVAAANKQAITDARKTLGIEDGVELTEANLSAAKKAMALKVHPDKGGSVEAMQQVNAAYDLLKASITPQAAEAAAGAGAATDGAATPNTPAKMTKAQEVQATKTSYQLMSEGKAVGQYFNGGQKMEILDVPEGTTVSTPSGYKTVGKSQVVIRENGTLDVVEAKVVADNIIHQNMLVNQIHSPEFAEKLCAMELLSDIPKELQAEAIELMNKNITSYEHDTYTDTTYKHPATEYFAHYSNGIDNRAGGGLVALKMDILENHGSTLKKLASQINSPDDYTRITQLVEKEWNHFVSQSSVPEATPEVTSGMSFEDAISALKSSNTAKVATDAEGNRIIVAHRNALNLGDYTYYKYDSNGKFVETGTIPAKAMKDSGLAFQKAGQGQTNMSIDFGVIETVIKTVKADIAVKRYYRQHGISTEGEPSVAAVAKQAIKRAITPEAKKKRKIESYDQQIEKIDDQIICTNISKSDWSKSICSKKRMSDDISITKKLESYGIKVHVGQCNARQITTTTLTHDIMEILLEKIDIDPAWILDNTEHESTIYNGDITIIINGKELNLGYSTENAERIPSLGALKKYLLDGIENPTRKTTGDPVIGKILDIYNLLQKKSKIEAKKNQLLGNKDSAKPAKANLSATQKQQIIEQQPVSDETPEVTSGASNTQKTVTSQGKQVYDKNGNPKTINITSEYHPDGRDSYTTYYANGKAIASPEYLQDYNYYVEHLKDPDICFRALSSGYDSIYKNRNEALQMLYGTSTEELISELPAVDSAPSKPIVIKDSEIPESSGSRDKLLDNSYDWSYGITHTRADITDILSCRGRGVSVKTVDGTSRQIVPLETLAAGDKASGSCLAYIKEHFNAEAHLDDIVKVDDFLHNRKLYIYHDKTSNLSTVFEPSNDYTPGMGYGTPVAVPLCQIAFNSHYVQKGDAYPTNYKVYSIYDGINKQFKALPENQ